LVTLSRNGKEENNNMLRKILALTVGLSGVSFAQPPTQQWSIITTTQIKPEFRMEYEAAQKELAAAYKKGGVDSRLIVQTILGDLGEYTSIVPLGKYAELDGPSPTVKALGETGSQRLLKKAGAYMNSLHRVTALAMPDISITTPMDNPGEYATVTTWKLFPGKAAEFIAFMKDDYIPAMRKAELKNFWVSRPIFGGDLDERITVRPMHKVAELDGGPLTVKALGADKAQELNAKMGKIVQSTHFSVVRVRPELSLMPAPPPTK
jgi:hypothetical protein